MNLEIGPLAVTALEVPSLEMEGNQGEWIDVLCRIRITADAAPSQKRDTLLHEVMHACWGITGTPEKDDGKVTEEGAIRALASLLLDTLRRNPHLVEYLTGDFDGLEDFESSQRGAATEPGVVSGGAGLARYRCGDPRCTCAPGSSSADEPPHNSGKQARLWDDGYGPVRR